MEKKKKIMNVFKVLFTIAFLYILITMIDVNEIIELYKSIPITTLIFCTICYALINALRALRFSVLTSKKVCFVKLLPIVFTHGIYNRVLPLRLGEGMFPYLMKKHNGTPVSESILSIIIVRIFDLLSTIFWFCATYIIYKEHITVFTVSIIVIIFVVITLGLPIGIYLFEKICGKFKSLQKYKYYTKIEKFINEQKNKLNLKAVIELQLISSLIWVLMFTIFNKILVSLDMGLSIIEIYLAGSVSNLSSILPISSVGNFGTMELGWSGILVMLGYGKEFAVTTGFLVNLFTFSSIIFWGLIGIVFLRVSTTFKERERNVR